MSLWKQSLLGLVVLLAAAALWARYYPGAPQRLADWGLDWIPVANVSTAGNESTGAPAGRGGTGGGPGLVVTAPVINATINDRLSAIGTGRALSSVSVKPLSSGEITEILVQSGARVEAGEAIVRLDSESEQIAVDRAKLTLDDAMAKLDRAKALRASNTVTQVQVTDAELETRNADLAVREAKLALDRRSVVAPISGVVGILPVNNGQYVTSETGVATIDDRSRILVDFWVPERFAGSVEVGMNLTATSIARPTEVFKGSVSAVDNRIDQQSRTLHVEGRITNPADRLRAGMAFKVAMRFPGDTFPAVDPLAIQWGTDGAFVWAVKDGRAHKTPVRIVQRNSDSVLVDGKFADGDVVVTQGIHNVRDGAEVMVAEQDTDSADTAVKAAARGT